MFQTLAHVENLQDLLLLAQLQRHVGGDRIGQAARMLDPGKRRQHLRGHLLVQFDVLLELGDDGTRQHVHLTFVVSLDVRQQGKVGRVVLGRVQLLDARAIDSLDQHLHGAVGQFEQLQDRGDGTDPVQIVGLRIVDVGLLLRDEHDPFVRFHGDIESQDGLLAPHEERNHHVRIYDYIAQWQDRHIRKSGDGNTWSGSGGIGHAQALDEE